MTASLDLLHLEPLLLATRRSITGSGTLLLGDGASHGSIGHVDIRHGQR